LSLRKFTNLSKALFLYSLLQVYGEGSGVDCRKHVQHLNLLCKNVDEQALAGCYAGDSLEYHNDSVACVDEPHNHVMTISSFN